jgi:hypothetical protein
VFAQTTAILLAVWSAIAAADEGSEMSLFLERIQAAYGGPTAVAQLESYRAEGTVQRAAGGAGIFVRDHRAPDTMKVEIGYPDRSELRLVVGGEVWRGTRAGVTKVEGPLRVAVIYQLLRSELPGVLLRNRDRLKDQGAVEHQGGSHRLLALRWSDEIEMRYWVDEDSSRVTHVESTLDLGAGQAVFATAYGDYREIDGVLFPFSETNYASGRHVADTRIDRLILDPEELRPIVPPEDSGVSEEPRGGPASL